MARVREDLCDKNASKYFFHITSRWMDESTKRKNFDLLQSNPTRCKSSQAGTLKPLSCVKE